MVRVCSSCGEENPDRARFCLACGTPIEAAPAPPAEERKVVSVLFVDLVGFTDRSDRADPEDVRATLRPYHERLKREIERFGGTVEKFIGDAVMAVFGAPVAHEDDAERAVRAALRILDAVDELGLEVRGAIGTGEAVVSLTARPERGEGIATGDVVNTAARLQNAAPVGAVVADETTVRATQAMIEYHRLEPVELKGKEGHIPLWRVHAARSRFGVDVEHGTRTPFFGRAHELTLLKETFARAERESSIQLSTVTGEPGVGKTRLVSEFRRWLDDRPDLVYWRQGRCLPYGEGITFWALGEIVKAQTGILESDSQDEATAKLAAAVEAVVERADREWVDARLRALVGGGSDGAQGDREEMFTAWRRFLEGVAATRPLVLVVEDLHWADTALVGFLEHLVDWATTVPIYLLCTARPEVYERHPAWGGGRRNSSTVSLSPLTAEDTTRLIAALLEQAVLPAETQIALLERAGGNPLYAEEFVRMLLDRGLLERRGRTYAVAADAAIPVPETVQALIAGRLDTLSPERKTLLQDAAVVGKVFWSGALEAVGGRDARAVEEGMRELVRKELVRPMRVSSMEGQVELSFWHLTIRDVAYGQIPRDARAHKHRAAAQWLASVGGDRGDELAELLAYHHEEALKLARAAGRGELAEELRAATLDLLVRAGDRVRWLDPSRAEELYRRALELAQPTDEQAVWARFKLLRTRVLGRYVHGRDEVRELEQVVGDFRERGDAVGEGEALTVLSTALWFLGETERSNDALRGAVAVLERLPESEQLADAYAAFGFQEMVAGHPERAIAPAERAIALSQQIGVVSLGLILGLQVRGGSRCDLGDPAGIDDLREALAVSEKAGRTSATAVAYMNLADFVWAVDGPREGLEIHRAGAEFSRRRALDREWSRAETLWMLFELGEWDEIVATADDLCAAGAAGSLLGQPLIIAETFKALVLAWRGDVHAALALVGSTLHRAREAQDPQVYQPALGVTALVQHARGNPAGARAAVEELASLLEERSVGFHGVTVPDAIRIALELGDAPLAERLLHRSRPTTKRQRNVILGGRAALAEAAGESDAVAWYREAAEEWRSYGYVLEEALARRGAARCGGTDADRRQGDELLARLGVQLPVAAARSA